MLHSYHQIVWTVKDSLSIYFKSTVQITQDAQFATGLIITLLPIDNL